MTAVKDLEAGYFDGHIRALNKLVCTAEAFEAPPAPDVPSWDASPPSFELDVDLTLEEARALGLEWQNLAVKLNDLLEESALTYADATDLHADAKEARLALIQLDIYAGGRS